MPKISILPIALALAAALALGSCKPKFTTKALPEPPKKAPEGTVFLVKRYSQVTDTGITAFDPGTEAHVESKRPGFVTLSVGRVKFEMPSSDVTDDIATRDTLVAQTASLLKNSADSIEAKRVANLEHSKVEQSATAQNIDTAKVQRLKDAIKSSQAELNSLTKAYQDSINSYTSSRTYVSTPSTYGNGTYTTSPTKISRGSSSDSQENSARRERMAALSTYISQCQTELYKLQSQGGKY